MEYYAIARSPLNSDNITITGNGCCPIAEGMQVVAIHGANVKNIFDTNLTIPGLVSCSFQDNTNAYTCQAPGFGRCLANGFGTCSASIETSTFDFVVATTAINDAPSCGLGYPHGIVPGFTDVSNQNNRFEVDYAIATPQSKIVFNCSGTDVVAIALDAISIVDVSGNFEDS